MSDEAQLRLSLNINAVNNAAPLVYQSNPTAFNVDMSSSQPPTPGGVLVTTAGVVIDISKVTTPGLATFANLGPNDDDNVIDIGIYNGVDFFPFLEVAPGQRWPVQLSRNLLQQYAGSSSASGLATVSLYAKARLAAVYGDFQVFQK